MEDKQNYDKVFIEKYPISYFIDWENKDISLKSSYKHGNGKILSL